METLFTVIASVGYIGLLPLFPGAWAALLTVLGWHVGQRLRPVYYWSVTLVVLMLGLVAANQAETIFAAKDASPIVIDEVVGVLVALALAAKLPYGWLVGLIGFLVLDGLKPFPASWADQQLGGGLGVMLDDVIAGLYVLCLVQGIYYIRITTRRRRS